MAGVTYQKAPANKNAGADGLSGVVWDGGDGFYYTRGNDGSRLRFSTKGATTTSGLNGHSTAFHDGGEYRFIGNPMGSSASKVTGQTDLTGGGGGGSQYTDTSAARGATQKGIDSLDEILRNNLADIDSRFNKINAQYGEEETLNKTRFGEQTSTNENNRTNTIQQSLLAAAQGGRGLMASLAALGALGGDGSILARRAVAGEANRDIGEGNRVFDANATQLNNAYADTQADEKRRRDEAADARVNEERAANTKIAEQRQSLFERMASLWGQAGNNSEAARYLGMVGEQAPIIARNSATQVSPYVQRNIGFEGGQLKSYLGGRNDMSVTTAPQSGGTSAVNSPLYSLTRRREETV